VSAKNTAAGYSVAPVQSQRAFWLRHLRQWHWVSSAICLIGLLFFALTGITLNHAADISAKPRVTEARIPLPAAQLEALKSQDPDGPAPLPESVAAWAEKAFGMTVAGRDAEWSEAEVYLPLPRPGGDAWISFDLKKAEAVHERTDRGWVSYLNDLHKGRHTGPAWSWFIDIFAGACFIFSLTGLALLQLYAGHRPSTWPAVGLGLLVPVLLALLFIH